MIAVIRCELGSFHVPLLRIPALAEEARVVHAPLLHALVFEGRVDQGSRGWRRQCGGRVIPHEETAVRWATAVAFIEVASSLYLLLSLWLSLHHANFVATFDQYGRAVVLDSRVEPRLDSKPLLFPSFVLDRIRMY